MIDLDAQQRRQEAYAQQALKLYNPDFSLTPEVLEIMRAFFSDLGPDMRGTISRGALADEIVRLDPSAETIRRIESDMTGRDERLDFAAFCDCVMHWKVQSPQAVQTVYTLWAAQIAALDSDMSDNLFYDLNMKEPHPDETLDIIQLLQQRQRLHGVGRKVMYEDYEASIAGYWLTSDEATKNSEPMIATRKFVDPADTSERLGSIMTISKSFIAGGMAGIIAKSTLAPLDRIKILFQVNDHHKFSFQNAARMTRDIYVHDGFHALFRGNMLNIIRVVPYAGLQHSGFDFFRHKFHAYNITKAEREGSAEVPKLSNLQLVAAGSLAGGLSLVVAYPLDIVRARYMVQMGKQRYTSIFEAVISMYKVEGMRSFSRGLLPSLLGTLPYTGIGFSLNERFKIWTLNLQRRRLEQKNGPGFEPSLNPVTKFMCSYFAACVAQTGTYPMDTIRRRIQTDGYVSGSEAKLQYSGIIATARIILAREGWRGFFKGVSVNWLRSPVSTGISLTAYDIFKEVLGVAKVE
ncbi:mitochondrial carrier family [Plasmopara halstedii]|uniref:Mitochondrial carrier family n=1 Tax=Plasmopara halstedii TaxID=4781 RepID=A0A0P1AN89_PLAHL|nr:mitochondrial carrier family [Plasmopara halstedii]CEG42837.1 mitochondrial carrier family [Plasmopara halstedii]|eukprot:XP_024579206.1 mitochondrial carrier family [Plasmopara halstedii]